MAWELRWHPFRGQWVLFTSHRGARPWIGEAAGPVEPAAPADNALAPGGTRLSTTNPEYRGVYVFTNDLPVFSPDAPEPGPGDELYRTRRASGTAEVVCYHHDPARSLADLTDDEVTAVVITWRERTEALQRMEGVAHVLIFENRGALAGTSNPHPHCQIYAGSLVYATAEREAEVACEHHARTGRDLLADVVRREEAGGRVVSEGEHFFACVPWFAQFAYEVVILPRRPATSLLDLNAERCRSLGLVLRDVVRSYDALWGFRMPYVLAVHQAPVGDHPHYPFHLELHPPLRAPGLLKYLAGPEVGGGSVTNESDPDDKAAELRAALADEARSLLCALGDHVRSLVVGARGRGDGHVRRGRPDGGRHHVRRRPGRRRRAPGMVRTALARRRRCFRRPGRPGHRRWRCRMDRHRRHHRRNTRAHVRQAASLVPRGGGPLRGHAGAGGGRRHDGVAHGQAGGGRPDQRVPQRRRARMSPRPRQWDAHAVDAAAVTRSDLEHGFGGLAKFFLPGKPELASLEAELFGRLGCQHVFDDEYLSTGGQLHELISGRDRFVADLRPLVAPDAHACHPYDVCTSVLLEEAGGVVTDPWGSALDAPLDTVTPVAWAGYANVELARWIGPVLAELVDGLRPG